MTRLPSTAAAIGLMLALAACGADDEAAPAATGPGEPEAAAATETVTAAPASPLDEYRRQADLTLAALADDGDADAAARGAEDLMRQGANLVPAFVQREPHCKAYLEAAMAVVEGWPEMDVATIEADYHDDGALPDLDDAGACYHMKDLIVHPATVLVILAGGTPDLAQARHEIQEVLAHTAVVEASLR